MEHRIIFATFASNLYRVSTAIQAAIDTGRKVAIFGRSMENGVDNGVDLGYLNLPKDLIVDADEINKLPPEKVMIFFRFIFFNLLSKKSLAAKIKDRLFFLFQSVLFYICLSIIIQNSPQYPQSSFSCLPVDRAAPGFPVCFG